MGSLRAMLRREGARTRLRIRFGAGERPHVFWVGRDVPVRVLSKRRPDGHLEVVVTRDDARGTRRPLGELEVDRDAPAGWLDGLVAAFAQELGTPLERFDLRHVETVEEWHEVASRMGWRAPGDDA